MSLLLDALKKAADDKQKILQESSIASDRDAAEVSRNGENNIASAAENHSVSEELSLQSIDNNEQTQERSSVNAAEYNEELTLDAVEESVPDDIENLPPEETASEQADTANNFASDRFTVSDEALSMLIQNTNRDVNRNKKIILAGIIFTSLAVLLSGGLYYYLDMQAEIAALERKHQIAMQSMRSKTSKEKTPEKSEIIRNLVSDAGLDEKVQYAKQRMVNEQKSSALKQKSKAVNEKYASNTMMSGTIFSIQKTNKTDPVGEGLDRAWALYENGQYGEAKKIYTNILTIEENNRDALLGMGAIAVIEKDESMAREVYLSLLKQDPRDPIATAALASLHKDEKSLVSDEQYILSMLQKNPEAPHLNFAMANIYAQQNKWKSAQQYYFNAWQQDTNNADYIFNLAVSMDQLNKHQQAIGFYRDSLAKSENRQVGFSRDAVRNRIKELTEM